MKNERYKNEFPKGPMIIKVRNKPKILGFSQRELGEMYDEVLKESKSQSPDQGGKNIKNGILVQANEFQPNIPEGSNYIKLDSEGYPIHPSEEPKFRKLNKIVGVDRWLSIFLVEAKKSRDITPGFGYELKASVIGRRGRPFIVDFGHTVDSEDPYKHIDRLIAKGHIYPAQGVIVPRKTSLLVDTMLGYSHNPIIIDWHKIPKNAFDDIKKAKENYWEPPFYED